MIHIKMLKSVTRDGKILRTGNVYEVTADAASVLTGYGDAEPAKAPKKKAAKKQAKAKPAVDATR